MALIVLQGTSPPATLDGAAFQDGVPWSIRAATEAAGSPVAGGRCRTGLPLGQTRGVLALRAMQEDDLVLVRAWLGEPRVARWYALAMLDRGGYCPPLPGRRVA